jgi:hypothetical protein
LTKSRERKKNSGADRDDLHHPDRQRDQPSTINHQPSTINDGQTNAIEGMTHFVLFATFIMLSLLGL